MRLLGLFADYNRRTKNRGIAPYWQTRAVGLQKDYIYIMGIRKIATKYFQELYTA